MTAARKTSKPRVLISSSQKAIRVPRRKIEKLVSFVAAAEGTRIAEADIAVVPAGQIAALNRRFLGHAGATDVLSFDMSQAGRGGISAQLVVCGDIARHQADARNIPPQSELFLYIIHGLLHLMGYEDSSIRGAAKMHAREEEILDAFLGKKKKKKKD
jgi:probable rRNA maturation factor